MAVKNKNIDFFSDEVINVCFAEDDYNEILTVGFQVGDSIYDVKNNCAVIKAENLRISYDEDYSEEKVQKIKNLIVDHLEIKKVREKNMHYAV